MAIHLEVERSIGAPPGEVFAVFTDLSRASDHVSSIARIEVLTPGPIRAGTRFRETRRLFGRMSTEEMEVTELEDGEHYTIECRSCGSLVRSSFGFRAEGGGTRVRVVVDARPESLLARFSSLPLIGTMSMRALRRVLERDLDDLSRAVEARAAERSTP